MEYSTNRDYLFLVFDRIKEYRIAQRLTQKELSEKSGISLSLLQRVEQHRAHNLTFLNLISILRALGMDDRINLLMPELPIPFEVQKMISKFSKKRIRHSKYDQKS